MSNLSGFYASTDSLKGIYYGPGCISTALPKLIQTLGVKKGLIVTGRSLAMKTDVLNKVAEVLKAQDAYAGVFTEFRQHTPIADIDACVEAFKDAGADFIIGLGGGSPICGAKGAMYRIHEQTGELPPPQIAIPTTLSAAEYTMAAGHRKEDGEKGSVTHQHLPPAGVILDAELSMPTPTRLWISSGIRALDHSVESLYRPFVSHPVKILCYAAMADLFKYLPISKADPDNVEARQRLLLAAWMSLWPMKWEEWSVAGPSHALGQRLGVRYNIPHGVTSCLTLSPIVAVQARLASAEDKKYMESSLFYLGEPSTGSTDGDILKLSALIAGLVERLGLKSALREYNVPKEDLVMLAKGDADTLEVLNGIY
ncbi:alcohol dehydrogenase IV [Favolaschia claudopus]|uniref:Alcohol dehydrogenase IV n=1 Tax=Favolaschia claudopus TaxID=2862362 RepID=A0AAW0AB33_9AGAR